MKNLYDLGYLEVKKLEKLVSLLSALNARLIDVRFSPNSRDPQWRKKAIEENLGERYIHLKALGNKNFNNSSEIQIEDLPGGLDALAQFLQSENVIIMCACWDRHQCHRLEIVKAFEKEYGLESVPLTDKLVSEIIDTTKPISITNT